MLLSQYFIPTMRETPSDATAISHQLMLRAGMIRQTASGIYAWLPLGLRVLQKIEGIVREEMNRAGAIECLLPTIQSADLWQQSERYDAYGPEMLKFKDRHGREMLYGPTAEELFTAVFKDCVHSYKQLPRTLYQFQWKFRDEIRPRNGVMRGREFYMKDAYSFDVDEDGARETYRKMTMAYMSAFDRMGLSAEMVAADSGPIGGTSHEFLVGGIEVGHIFSFGTKYSEKLDLKVSTPDGLRHVFMGSYGIGVSRLVAAIIEANHDENGIIWPDEVAPFRRLIINASPNDELSRCVAEEVYDRWSDGETLLDDRDTRGKFIEGDLLGIPEQYIVGAKNAAASNVEIKDRRSGERRIVKVHEI